MDGRRLTAGPDRAFNFFDAFGRVDGSKVWTDSSDLNFANEGSHRFPLAAVKDLKAMAETLMQTEAGIKNLYAAGVRALRAFTLSPGGPRPGFAPGAGVRGSAPA